MTQWREAKSRHPDALIFFRVGDFYEMFCEDAEEGARLLGLTLTSRNNGGAAAVPLAGVPVRARDEYLQKLVRLGRRVAICEQVEDQADAKGIVRREVVETVTPGAVLADSLLTQGRNNYLVALVGGADGVALAAADLSTGELRATLVARDALASELGRWEAAELLLPRSWEAAGSAPPGAASVTYRPDWLFDAEAGAEEIRRRFRIHALEGYGIGAEDTQVLAALGGLLAYLGEVQPAALAHLRPPRVQRSDASMLLDEMTRRNLELVEPLRTDADGRAGTLIEVTDETRTAPGARMLRRWILSPLLGIEEIWARQDAVSELLEHAELRRKVRGELERVRDVERLAARAAAGRIAPRELRALAESLGKLPPIVAALADVHAPLLEELATLDPLDDVQRMLGAALADDPPATLADGGVIRDGFDAELDDLRATHGGAVDFIAALQTRERERSGIPSLKVGYNRVFGYFIEVTRTNSGRVPADYERRQTLANAERYVTPELKEWESRALSAEERILELETRIFNDVRARVAAEIARIQRAADAVATLDVLAGLAQLAERRGYVRPEVHSGFELVIEGMRHPVVETMMPREAFIPNDITLDADARIIILTGPNMAGKSTLLRALGLVCVLAQIGAFVPATRARLPLCDRIFTRVGASDNLVRGQSTFMVEMNETSAILHNATARSLVLLDEIGRGTATYDGVSIAWAVTEHLHEAIGAKTIFATHYHELTQLGDMLPGLVNFNVAVKETGGEIVFLHQLRPGGADRSYGIDVGRLAGLPPRVVERAKEILRELEGAHTGGGAGLGRHGENRPDATITDQLSLFHAAPSPVLQRLREMDVDKLTPLEALNALAQLQKEAKNG